MDAPAEEPSPVPPVYGEPRTMDRATNGRSTSHSSQLDVEGKPRSVALGQGLLDGDQGDDVGDAGRKIDEKLEAAAIDDGVPKPRLSSIPRAAFNIFKGNVGAGVFLLPTAYTEAGYVFGPIFAILCGLMVIDCSLMLLRCKTRIGRPDVQTYPQVAKFVYGDVMLMMVNVALVLTQFGFVLLYLQFSAGVFEVLIPFTGAYKVYVLIGTLIVTPLTFLTGNLRLLAITSIIASVCVFYCIAGTFGYTMSNVSSGVSCTIEAVEDPSKWVLFFASQMTVLEGIGIVLPVENSVKHKEKFPGMLRATLGLIVIMYLTYGVAGYVAYGSELTTSLVNILPASPFTTTVQVALATQLLLTAPLQFVPAIQIVDKAMKVPPHMVTKSTRAIAARVVIMLILMMLGMMIGPDALGLILAFIGSIAATFIAVILPAFLELLGPYAAEHPDEKRNASFMKNMFSGGCTFRRVRAYIFAIVGAVIMIVGTVTCIIDATKLFGHKVGTAHRPGVNGTNPHANFSTVNTSNIC